MEDNVFTSEELQAILECASDPIYLYEDFLVMFRINLKYTKGTLFTSNIVLGYCLALIHFKHRHDAYRFADECEQICGAATDPGLLVDIKKMKIFMLSEEHRWARAEKEALCILDIIEDNPDDIHILTEYGVRRDLAFVLKRRRKYQEAREQRRIANCLQDLFD